MTPYRNRIREYRTVNASEIQRNALNFRRHPEHQRAALRGLLTSVGRVAPLLAWEDNGVLTLLDGHARLDESDTWDVAILDIDESEAATVLAMLDKIGASAEIDPEALIALLDSLPAAARQAAGAAWSDDELAALLEDARAMPEAGGGGDEFNAEPEEGETRTQLGDLWHIGPHRLLVGDCTDAANVARLMGGERAALLVTSPPYWANQEYDDQPGTEEARAFMALVAGAWSEQITRRILIQTGATNAAAMGDKGPLEKVLLDALWADALRAQGWLLRHRRGWMKGGNLPHVNPIADMIDESWEVILTFYRPKHNEGGQERVGEPWALKGYWDDIPGEGIDGHPCPYPIELARRMLLLYSVEGDIVAEPFFGSGTTLISAHRTGRRCYGMEIAPRYADVILRRAEAEGLTVERAAT